MKSIRPPKKPNPCTQRNRLEIIEIHYNHAYGFRVVKCRGHRNPPDPKINIPRKVTEMRPDVSGQGCGIFRGKTPRKGIKPLVKHYLN